MVCYNELIDGGLIVVWRSDGRNTPKSSFKTHQINNNRDPLTARVPIKVNGQTRMEGSK